MIDRTFWIACAGLAAVVAATGCAWLEPEPPPEPAMATMVDVESGEPGGVFVGTAEVSARVVAVDHRARTATILLPNGERLPIDVGPDVVNFDQVEKNDIVTIRVSEAVTIGMADPDAVADDVVETEAALPTVGAKPAAAMTGRARFTGTVIDIDREARTATLEFGDGSTQVFDVRPDVDLERRSIGEKVVFEVSRQVSIGVRPD
jgi:hypothetical protein